MPLNLPSAYPGNPAGYVTYYKAQADNYSMSAVYARNPLESQTTLNWEMSSMLAQCSRSIATKVYVADAGNWSTAANWYPVGVPAAGDNVLIGEGVSVTYDVDSPATSLSFVRIDGTIYHPHNASTAINVNTIFITPTGKHQVATETTPLSASRTCRIIFSSSTDMDPAVDTALQTKGIVSAGTRQYFGSAKTHLLKVASNAGPAAGATGVVLEAAPSGWKVGDRITICGTRFGGYYNRTGVPSGYMGDEEETRTITAIGLTGTLSLDSALSYGHTAPSSTLVATNTMRAYVANLTRNISFSTENGTTCLRHRRAHDMQMHYPTFDARWVEWRDMGRTNKGGDYGGIAIADGVANVFTTTTAPNGLLASGGTVSLGTETILTIRAGGSPQNLTVDGFDRSGTAISNTVLTTAGEISKFYTRITGLRLASAAAVIIISVDHRSRLMTSSGIRNTNGQINNSTAWTYETPYKEANIQGRYPVHFHKCGVIIDVFTSPISMLGCVVSSSPGWGFAHHLSHANLIKCVAHDCSGAGFVAEAGNETGIWKECYASKMKGIPSFTFKGDNGDSGAGDPGRGAAYWFTGRMIKVESCVGTDSHVVYWYNSRFELTKLVRQQLDQPSTLLGFPNPGSDQAPIIHFRNNESIASCAGFFVTKNGSFQEHDVRTFLENHLSWSCEVGFETEYTAHYTYANLTCVRGTAKLSQFAPYSYGLAILQSTSDQVVVNPKFDGFNIGFERSHQQLTGEEAFSLNGSVVISPTFANCTSNYGGFNSSIDYVVSGASLTSTASLSLSTTANGSRRYVSYTVSFSSRLNDAPANPVYSGWRLSGEKRDSLYNQLSADLGLFPQGIYVNQSRDYPIMRDGSQTNFAIEQGTFNDAVLGLTFHMPAFYANRVTGELNLKLVPATVKPGDTAALSAYLRGTADYTKYDLSDGLPNPQNLRVSLTAGTTTNVNFLAGATHSLSISMYVAAMTKPFGCHVVDNNNGTATIVPHVGYTGTETFSFWVADNNANVAKRSVIVEVLPQSGATGRSGVNDFIATQNNTAVSVNVLANDIGDTKVLQTATVVGGNAVGTASISTGGIIVFTPTSTYATIATQTAEVQYTFTASGGSAGASLFVTVNPPATGRAGVADFNSTTYNVAVSTNVLANDVGDSKVLLTATVVGGNSVGTASISTGGIIVFTPTNTFARTITQVAEIQYTFTASGGSAGASLFVTVNAGPPLPVAVADFTSTTYNQAVSFNVLANDTGGTTKTVLTASVVGGNSVGTASISTGGVIVFTPSSTFAVTLTQVAEIQYTFTTTGGSAAGSLFVTVNAGPSLPASITYTAPVAEDGNAQAYVGRLNGTFVFRHSYDTNPNGYLFINQAARIDGVTGSVDFDPAGIVYVTPDAAGTMRVTYRIVNGANLTDTGVITFQCVEAPLVGGSNGGSRPMIGAPVSWSRKSVSNIKSVARAISAVFADLDPNDPIRLAERMVRKYSYAEIKKLIGTADFESLLDMELQELVDEMERMKNGN